LYFKGNTKIVQFTITKIVVLSALFYGLSITNRNYKAHKHNGIMNKHRQNALSTFEIFSKAASADDQTKNAILLETTHSIFSNQQTAYLKSEGNSDSSNKIIEIIKSATKKGE
jgi:anti-sigma28 factor (negative regulator of flagellin synthesis)